MYSIEASFHFLFFSKGSKEGKKISNYTRKFIFPATKHKFNAHTSQNKPEIVHIKCKARETEIQRENRNSLLFKTTPK